jgi:hypothetical protein
LALPCILRVLFAFAFVVRWDGVPSKTLVIHFDFTFHFSHVANLHSHFHFSLSLLKITSHLGKLLSFTHNLATSCLPQHHHHDVRLATITIIVINFQEETPLSHFGPIFSNSSKSPSTRPVLPHITPPLPHRNPPLELLKSTSKE